jgi:hypothetical protein
MSGRKWMVLAPVLASAGCLIDDAPTALVPESPFGRVVAPPAQARAAFAPASTASAARVDTVGRKIVEANPQLGIKPLFRTIGAPGPEIFHVGTAEVDITEGLANQCKTDGELAAVLSHELGKMISEREALAGVKTRSPEREPPAEVRMGNDYAGGAAPDQTRLAELGKFEKTQPRRFNAPPPLPPDPQVLARGYLTKAGYTEKDLDLVAPLLQEAMNHATFEKQLASPASPNPGK